MKNLSDRELTQTDQDVLAKDQNFAVTLEEVPEEEPVVDLITATEPAISNTKLSEAKAEQIGLKVSAALANAKSPTSPPIPPTSPFKKKEPSHH